jgi:hypothetical protein
MDIVKVRRCMSCTISQFLYRNNKSIELDTVVKERA